MQVQQRRPEGSELGERFRIGPGPEMKTARLRTCSSGYARDARRCQRSATAHVDIHVARRSRPSSCFKRNRSGRRVPIPLWIATVRRLLISAILVPFLTSGCMGQSVRVWGMRSVAAFFSLLACLLASGPVLAAGCAGNPNALGTSRTIVVDPAEHNRLGGFQYAESLPLEEKEVVITFDDGPLPPYSTHILDTLARECVKATFFMVGRMARAYPQVVRRVDAEGHTLANHSQSHPFNFHSMTVQDAAREIKGAFESIRAAVGDPAKVAPFFHFPGLHRQEAVERYLASRGMMTWSVDLMADDWTRISSREIVQRALSRLEARGKGILLLHDIKPATALGLQELLDELKARRYRVVHVVAATADRPKTKTIAEQWLVPTRRDPTGSIAARPAVERAEAATRNAAAAKSTVSMGERFRE